LEDRAIRAAVDHVAPAIVRIETFGGLERVGRTPVGEGPTTGVVVSPEGFVICSAFNFAKQPTSILVTVPDGPRAPAQIVARDHSRMLVLLKVETDQALTVPEAAPRSEMRVGQWTIAVGRTFDVNHPNVSVGILSAKNRIWGKAIQTDAKISPSNYGGPLVDIRGRVLGILVPLSPDAQNEMAGTEWYDSGIGFAIPLVDIQRQLRRLQAGEDLFPGRLGAALEGEDIYSTPTIIAAVQVNSPAHEAGLQVGDTVVEVDDTPIDRPSQFKHALGPRYAGEEIHLTVLREESRVEVTVKLTDKLIPYEHPFVGLLPARDATADPGGVVVRYLYPDRGASQADVRPGDRIVALAEKPIADAEQLRVAVANQSVGDTVVLGIERSGRHFDVEVVLSSQPTLVPKSLPASRAVRPRAVQRAAATGFVEIKIPEQPNECVAWVPEDYDPGLAYGIVVCLPVPGDFDRDAFKDRWEALCKENDLIALAPLPQRDDTWQRTEVEFVRKSLDDLIGRYSIDRTRVVVYGYQAGGAMAYLLAFRQRDLVRGMAVIDAAVPARVRPPDNDPLHRLAIYMVLAEESRAFEPGQATADLLRSMKYPVTVRHNPGSPHRLTDAELAELLRWVDTLDRI
ncbi:MAG: PDZ domain-containing protein, partial [Pirellulales bacterium]